MFEIFLHLLLSFCHPVSKRLPDIRTLYRSQSPLADNDFAAVNVTIDFISKLSPTFLNLISGFLMALGIFTLKDLKARNGRGKTKAADYAAVNGQRDDERDTTGRLRGLFSAVEHLHVVWVCNQNKVYSRLISRV